MLWLSLVLLLLLLLLLFLVLPFLSLHISPLFRVS